MSSPASRRVARRSQSGTPRQNNRNSELSPISSPAISDINGADSQLQSEASQAGAPSSDGIGPEATPRPSNRISQDTSQSQAPATSSPLFYRSSPGGSQSQSINGAQNRRLQDISSPLRRSVAPGSDATTPRAAAGYGGE